MKNAARLQYLSQPLQFERVRAFRPSGLDSVEAIAWHVTDNLGDWRQYRREQFAALPRRFALALARRCAAEWDAGNADAHHELARDIAAMQVIGLPLNATDADVCEYAEDRALACWTIAQCGDSDAATYEALADRVRRLGIEPPSLDRVSARGAVLRLADVHWWRRQLRRAHGRAVERVAIGLGFVSSHADLYASAETVTRRHQQKTRNRRILESILAVNELGDTYTLAELSELSVSNPVIRRGELMTRAAGFEKVADHLDHAAWFYTWTCPGRMHARDSVSGEENKKYDGTTPREAQAYLNGQWQKARAALQRDGIALYGIRVAEPHHDGTPHWHMLFYMPREHIDKVNAILRRYAMQVDGDEAGADEHRFKAVEIDRDKGRATGYLAKYIAKNIDGFGVGRVDEDLTGARDPGECAGRVDAWASTWGIRQFQQIGGPQVTVWRELRRLHNGAPAGVIGTAWMHADGGNWCGFVEGNGGTVCKRADRPVQLATRTTGEVNKYDELKSSEVYGVRAGPVIVPTRIHSWHIKRKRKDDDNLPKGATGEDGGGGAIAVRRGHSFIDGLAGVRSGGLSDDWPGDGDEAERGTMGSESRILRSEL